MKTRFSVLKMTVLPAVLFLLCFAGNRYLHGRKADCFVEAESFVEEGKSEINRSEDGLFTYRLDLQDDTAMLVSYQGVYLDEDKKIRNLVIPETLDGHEVGCIDEAVFSMDEYLETITLPSGLKELRRGFMFNLPNMKQVVYEGDSLTDIDEDAFYGFDGEIVTIKDSVLWDYAIRKGLKVSEK